MCGIVALVLDIELGSSARAHWVHSFVGPCWARSFGPLAIRGSFVDREALLGPGP